MRKLTVIAYSVATTILLAACQPAAKEEAAAPEATEVAPVVTETAPVAEAPADAAKVDETAAMSSDEAAATETKGTEHTGGIKVGQ